MSKRNQAIIFIAGLLILVLIPTLGNHFSAASPAGASPTAITSDADRAGVPFPAAAEAQLRQNFTNSPGMGTCVLAATEQRYSYNEYVSIAHAYGGTNTLPPSLQTIIQTCASRLQ
jgi:hypothetical protein